MLVASFLLISGLAFGQDKNFDPIRDVIKTGNAKEVARFLNQSVDIQLDGGVSNTYSKAQAEFVLRDFFRKHPPSELTIVHSGSNKGGLHYAVATYKSSNESYNVMIRVRQVEDQYLIHEMMFEKE